PPRTPRASASPNRACSAGRAPTTTSAAPGRTSAARARAARAARSNRASPRAGPGTTTGVPGLRLSGSHVDHLFRHPAVHDEVLAGDEPGVVRKQVVHDLRDVLGTPDAAHRVLRVVGAGKLQRLSLRGLLQPAHVD